MPLISTLSKQRLDTVGKKNSLLCAGLDPAVFEMGRGGKGLGMPLDNQALFDWSAAYITAVAPYVSGLKYNLKYWGGEGQVAVLKKLIVLAKSLDLFITEDSKIADIGSTNDAAFYWAQQLGTETITLAPYAGNMKGSIADATERNLGIFTMCLMSNPEYASEKNILTLVDGNNFAGQDVQVIDGKSYVPRYIYLAQQAAEHGALGVVIGAPGEHNHIEYREVERVAHYLTDDQLILCPGTGAQGGSPDSLLELFGERVIVALSRGLMFPEGSGSTPEDQAGAAKFWQEKVNDMRR